MALQDELKELLIRELNLQDVRPDEVDPAAPLFGGDLGLDSIDALELAIVLERTYGLRLGAGDERNTTIFASLNALAEFVAANRTK